MIWIISAVLLGLILGVLGFYFSKLAISIFVTLTLSITATLLLIPGVEVENISGWESSHNYIDILYFLGGRFTTLPEHIQLAALLFTISFFVARIITWFLVRMSLMPRIFGTETCRVERMMEEYSYDSDDILRDGHYYG